LTGLEIYELLPKTNCRDCEQPTCLAFAIALAAKQAEAEACPHLSAEAKAALLESSLPPVRRVAFGPTGAQRELGGETVLFRHEKKFVQPTVVAVAVPASLPAEELRRRLQRITALRFERVGEQIGVGAVALMCDRDMEPEGVARGLRAVQDEDGLPLIIRCEDPAALRPSESELSRLRPLLWGATERTLQGFLGIHERTGAPLVLEAADADSLAALSTEATGAGCDAVVLAAGADGTESLVCSLTTLRREAVEGQNRAVGFPLLVHVRGSAPEATMPAVAAACRYAGVVVVETDDPAAILPLATAVQSIYADPQAPATVEPGLYEVGGPDRSSPLLVTTNFALTFYSVQPEVESARVPAWLLVTDSDGQSVLTAWAADRFNGTIIAQALKQTDAEAKVDTREIIIPGQVAVIQGDVEDETGWKVVVGPREASGIPAFLRSLATAGVESVVAAE
jgi:acetyl-CoA decarbonylase/synthase complex subunit gamma